MFKYSPVFILVLAMACGKKEEIKPIDPATLQGTWMSSCLASSDQYEQKSVKFEGAEATMTSNRYSDDACSKTIDQLQGFGLFGIVAVDATKSDMTPNLVNYVFESIRWTFVSDPSTAVDYAVVCESTAVDGVVDLLDKSCTMSDSLTKDFSSKSYGILEIRNGQLFITDFDSNGVTPETRPTQYPAREGFTLQKEITESGDKT